ncbi:hypothetical protein [Thiocystis violacea]|uniref:hypothetical protein n=1 Tax=Thiocystis violacea TaxID=13725 RepID=UPI001902ECD1|nr:hypothetical protein [Thiocystis violacea]MBK1722636.1 hypothetical protein [Thiocystis violacea]
MRRAIDASRKLTAGQRRDGYLLRLLQQRIFAGQTSDTASILDAISTTEAHARAYAYLALADQNERLAERHFQLALRESDKIEDALGRVMAQGEIARVMAHTSLKQHADAIFARAEKQLEEMAAGDTTDQGWASLAKNRARALDTSGAASCVRLVQDPRLQAIAQEDLLAVTDAVKDLKATEKVTAS